MRSAPRPMAHLAGSLVEKAIQPGPLNSTSGVLGNRHHVHRYSVLLVSFDYFAVFPSLEVLHPAHWTLPALHGLSLALCPLDSLVLYK
jgi:hypothetical protein